MNISSTCGSHSPNATDLCYVSTVRRALNTPGRQQETAVPRDFPSAAALSRNISSPHVVVQEKK
jgi:hypothetical protein